MLHGGCCQRRSSKLVGAGLAAIFLAALSTKEAAADGVNVVVEVLVDASTAGGLLLGLPVITEEDGEVIKLIVRCAANGDKIVKCARQQVIEQLHLPSAVDPLVNCILAHLQQSGLRSS
jgi:hypothetical protein